MTLQEILHLSLSSPPLASSHQKNTGTLHTHAYLPSPRPLTSHGKSSLTPPSCLAVSPTHIFTAQANKSVVNVYARPSSPRNSDASVPSSVPSASSGSHEAIIPFPSRITSLALTCSGSVLICGTEQGALVLWELYTGRVTTTSSAHLHPVSHLSCTADSSWLLSASKEGVLHIWSLLDLLSFPAPSTVHAQGRQRPRRSINAHTSAITCLGVSHATGTSGFAVTGGDDSTLKIWDFLTGVELKTVLLGDVPRALTIDPADRACYVGYADGSVQCSNFFAPTSPLSLIGGDPETKHVAYQPPASSRWYSSSATSGASATAGAGAANEGSEENGVLSLALSHDATELLTGHTSGVVKKWDIARGAYTGDFANYPGAPVSNILFERPAGFATDIGEQKWRGEKIVKPRVDAAFSMGEMEAGWAMRVALSELESGVEEKDMEDLLDEGAKEMEDWLATSRTRGVEMDDEIPLTDEREDELERLRKRVKALEGSNERQSRDIVALKKERNVSRAREEERMRKRRKKEAKVRAANEKEWAAIAQRQQKIVGMVPKTNGWNETHDDESMEDVSELSDSSGG